jgi:hypothetical protein
MLSKLPLVTQTIYAELVDLCTLDEFDAAFPPNGSFVAVTVKGRRYWYYQSGAADDATGRQGRKYVGPDSDSTAALVTRHGAIKSSYRQRRSLVAALRKYGLPSPFDETGKILRGLAGAGVFRLRTCLVGTIAYQTYGGVLGVKLPAPALQTADLDLAQSRTVSVAIAADEQTPAFLDILQRVEPSFRAVPNLHSPGIAATYVNGDNYRVELLTDNRGPESDRPAALPALGTYAQPLRFLDFLLADAIQAAVLWDGGVLVNVPQPERYAVHKLIVSERRTATAAKRPKDLFQASSLCDALAEHRAHDLAAAWKEAWDRGPQWRKHLRGALPHLDPPGRDRLLYAIGQPRSFVSGADIEFRDARPVYDFSRDAVAVRTAPGGHPKDYAVSREALHDWFGAEGEGPEARIRAFQDHRAEIEAMARDAYFNEPVPANGSILIRTADVPRLRKRIQSTRRRMSESRARRRKDGS